jgi:RHS repeat-associated protein
MRSWIALILTLLVAFAGISQAQGVIPKHPRPFICTPPNCNYPPPTVSISPGTETVTTASVAVTITMCDTLTLANDTVYLNGGNVTSNFTSTSGSSSGCFVKKTLTWTVPLNLGANTLRAVVSGTASNGNGLQQASASVTYTYALSVYSATVTVAPQLFDTARAGQQYTTTFTVKNTGNVTDSLNWTASCSGPAIQTCGSVSPTGKTLTAGSSFNVNLTWTAASLPSATGSISLTANDGGTASGVATETVIEYATGLDVVDVNPGPSFNRGNCLTIAVAPRTAAECGALRIAHALPSVRTYNKTRTPTLIYNSRLAAPFMPINASLTIPAVSGTTLSSVSGQLKVWQHATGTPTVVASGTWPGGDWGTLSSPMTRRLQLIWQYGQEAHDGLYDYTFTTTRTYANNTTSQDSASGQLILANRYTTPEFGLGWYLAGLERIHFSDSAIVWVDGDGSTQLYVPSGTTNVWVPKTYVAGRDSITFDGTAYTRHASHGGRVVFAAVGTATFQAGMDTAAFDRLGRRTGFQYDSQARLSRINIPSPSNDTAMYYAFAYTLPNPPPTWYLQQVSAPGPNGSRRLVTLTNRTLVITAAAARLQIQDPDGTSIKFTYSPEQDTIIRTWDLPVVMQSDTDRRGTVTAFTFAPDYDMLASATIQMQGTGHDIVRSFTTPGFGTAAPDIPSPHAVVPDSVFIVLHGPRSHVQGDSADTLRFWFDQRWQPTRVRDAHLAETRAYRLNATYPTRVTRLNDPLSRVETALYDRRGNDSVITDFGTYVNGQYATTKYQFDSLFDFVTSVRRPDGEVDSTLYDGTGNAQWTQDGRGRTTFGYDGYNLLNQVTDGKHHTTHLTQESSLGNLQQSQTPIGFNTFYYRDALGRDTLTQTPIDSAQDTVSAVRVVYDVMDRVDSTVTIAPYTSSRTNNADTTIVAMFYDADGADTAVKRRISPDPATIGPLTTRSTYDALGRKVRDYAVDGVYDSVVYDPASNVVQTLSRRKDGNGRRYQVNKAYDALNRLVLRTTDSVFYASIRNWMDTTAAHDADNSIVHDSFPAFHTTQNTGYTIRIQSDTFGYDARGSLVLADNPDARVHRTYNLDGTLATDSLYIRTVAGTNFTTHAYGMSFAYDREGRRTLLSSNANLMLGSGTIRYAYDTLGAGQIAQIIDQFGRASTYTYDSTDLLVRRTTPGYQQIDYGYDADGRLIGDTATLVSDPIGITADTAHDDATLRAEVIHYNARGQVVSAANSHENKESITQQYTPGGQPSTGTRNSSMSTGPRSWTAQTTQETSTVDLFGSQLYDSLETSHKAYQNIGGYSGSSAIPSATGSTYQHGTGRLATQAYRDALGLQSGLPFFGSGDQMVATYDSEGNRVAMLLSATGQENDYTNQTFYYGADNKLRASDASQLAGKIMSLPIMSRTFEEYRYDALGRRIVVYTRRACENGILGGCVANIVRRTVWDGASELVDIQMPDTSSLNLIENDVAPVGTVVAKLGPGAAQGFCITTGYYGRTIYINGPALDEPVEFVRADFEQDIGSAGICSNGSATHHAFGSLVYSPIYDWQGHAKEGSLANGAAASKSVVSGDTLFAQPPWIDLADNYHRLQTGGDEWWGKVTTENADGSGLLYRRHRYYDPNSGQFTQEDPIGLAGGLNAYGFAGGDPVNYSDPFGLDACLQRGNCTQVQGGEREGHANQMKNLGKALAWGTKMMLDLYVLGAFDEPKEVEAGAALAADGSAAAEAEWPAAAEGETRVSRWMSEGEATQMRSTGTLQVGAEGRTYVTLPGAPKPGGTSNVRVDFNIQSDALKPGGNMNWRVIFGGNTIPINGIQRVTPPQ